MTTSLTSDEAKDELLVVVGPRRGEIGDANDVAVVVVGGYGAAGSCYCCGRGRERAS